MKGYVKTQARSRAKTAQQKAKHIRKLRRENQAFVEGLLEEEACKGAQEGIQTVLEVERDQFLGRDSHERVTQEEFSGHRNGYSDRTVTLGCGPIAVKMPRVRNNVEPFESRLLARYQRSSHDILDALPKLYLCGLSGGDFREALSALFGDHAALSSSTVARLRVQWQERYITWHKQPLDTHYAYVYADGVFIRVGAAGEKIAFLVVIGVNRDGRKKLLVVMPGYREDYGSWLDVFRHLAARGVKWIGLCIADGLAGLWKAFGEVFPEAKQQRDWMHKIRNVLMKIKRDDQLQKRAKKDLHRIYNAESRAESNRLFRWFAEKYREYPGAVHCLLEDRKELTAYFDFPREHWRSIRTSNAIESSFDPVKTRVRKAKRMVREEMATAMVHQLLLQREARWKSMDYAELVAALIAGAKFRDGRLIKTTAKQTA